MVDARRQCENSLRRVARQPSITSVTHRNQQRSFSDAHRTAADTSRAAGTPLKPDSCSGVTAYRASEISHEREVTPIQGKNQGIRNLNPYHPVADSSVEVPLWHSTFAFIRVHSRFAELFRRERGGAAAPGCVALL
jgi:hypothetical protein